MSNATLWAALQQSSLVGADRLAVPAVFTAGVGITAPITQQAVQSALLQPAASTAAQVLRASAVAAVLERAGWVPGAQVRLKAPLVLPALPAAESRTAFDDARLQALMREVFEEGPQELLSLAFESINQSGQRLPYDLLVDALNQGRQSVELRHWLTPVLGERGRWLAALNPQWAYASGVEETANPEVIWQEGSIDQRVGLLISERETDPAQARARLEGSLKELSAKERAPMVKTLDIGLSVDDEPLLEKLLTDRSKEVRETAARLLSRLPDSAHSQRLGAWLKAMLSQDAKGEWQIESPEEGSKDWERDGITLQLPTYVKGAKAWWLQQLVEMAPLDFWPQTLNKTPEQLWEWSRRSDWKTALRQGWLAALQTQHDVRWLPLLQSMDRDARATALLPNLLDQLNEEQREALWLERLQNKQGQGALIENINNMDDRLPTTGVFSAAMSDWIVDALYKALGGKQAQGNWHSWQADRAMLACARRLHTSSLQRFAALWREAAAAVEAAPEPTTESSEAAEKLPLTEEQQTRLARARLRPWDDERVLAQLNRIVDFRQALQAATTV